MTSIHARWLVQWVTEWSYFQLSFTQFLFKLSGFNDCQIRGRWLLLCVDNWTFARLTAYFPSLFTLRPKQSASAIQSQKIKHRKPRFSPKKGLIKCQGMMKIPFQVSFLGFSKVSLGRFPFGFWLKWEEIWPIWVCNYLIDVKWEVTLWLSVETSFFISFNTLYEPLTLLIICQSMSSYKYFLTPLAINDHVVEWFYPCSHLFPFM